MAFPWPSSPPTAAQRAAFADATVRPYWLDALPPREPAPPLEGPNEADLCIVGAGFTGLWAALHAKADDPARDIVVLEGDTVGFGASGRNGGFALGSLTHGIENGLARFAAEMPQLERIGRENFQGFVDDIERLGIDSDLELTGDLAVALEPHEVEWLKESAELLDRFGHNHELFDIDAVRAEIASPIYLAGLWDKTHAALVDPGKLAAGLADAALAAGVRLHKRSRATRIVGEGTGVRVETATGHVSARRVLLATSAYPPLIRAIPPALRPLEAGAVPPRAAACGRDPADAEPARRSRPERRPPRALAPDARPARPGLRQLASRSRKRANGVKVPPCRSPTGCSPCTSWRRSRGLRLW